MLARRPRRRLLLVALAVLLGVPLLAAPAGAQAVTSEEDVLTFGDASFHGSTAGVALRRPLVGMAPTAAGTGYWLVAADGGIFAYGTAGFHGSTGGTTLNRPVVGMAATPTGGGYWLVAADGGTFAFGDAAFHGSTGGTRLNSPVVGMAATPTGGGYWLVAADGGTFAFGDAGFHGSGVAPNAYRRVVGMASTPTGGGYRLVTSGECVFAGSPARRSLRPDSHVVQQTAVRTGAHECFDRVVFEFQVELGPPDAALSYQVGYETPPFSGPSGIPVGVDGNAFLELVLFGARAHDGNTGAPTYTGPSEIRPGLGTIRELQLVEDFEATLSWVIGLDRQRAFNVFELDAPDRLVVDVGHG